jgi:hypothetical protein
MVGAHLVQALHQRGDGGVELEGFDVGGDALDGAV